MKPDTEWIVITVLYAITMLVAFAGNSFLIYIVWKKPEVRSLTSFMFVNMAIADLLVTLIVMPWSISTIYTGGLWSIWKGHVQRCCIHCLRHYNSIHPLPDVHGDRQVPWPEICDSQRFETGARVSKKIPTTHAFLHQITCSKLWRAA